MKKMMTAMLMILLLGALFTGCSSKDEFSMEEPIPMTDEEETSDDGQVFFSALNYDQEKGTLRYVIQNDSNETISIGGDILLEVRAIDGLWVDVMPLEWNGSEVINGPIIRIITIDPGRSSEGEIIISATFGELSDGDYRITIEISSERGSETISGDFTVAPMR